MSYVVLARKWRPKTFDDLVGQQHVSRTLTNAIASDRVAHAFLFSGVRGVGKTTSARILARALNCEKGPTATPCLECRPCIEIGAGTDVDVQEIDGASYTGVDAVRTLQESLPYRPARDRFKIYIVDEVHMLSTAAWNAFLKTLEEPPPHIKFIFATTEAGKVPVTILSRCQCYDFKLIAGTEIATRLRHVLDAENIKADDAALGVIAREAAGSMRDAMSMLDQVIAWVGESAEGLTADGVGRVLGVASRSVLHELGAALVTGDANACLQTVASLATNGYRLQNVARDFLDHLHDLVFVKVSQASKVLLELSDAELADLSALAAKADANDLSRLYLGFSRALDDIMRSGQPRGAFEMALVRLTQRPPLLPIDDLIKRLAALESRLAGADGSAPPSRGEGRQLSGTVPAPGSASTHPSSASTHPSPSSVVRDPPSVVRAPPSVVRAPPSSSVVREPPSSSVVRDPSSVVRDPSPASSLDPARLRDWESILANLATRKAALAAVYEHGAPLVVARGHLSIAFPAGSFLLEQARHDDAQKALTAVATAYFGVPTELKIDITGQHDGVQTVAQKNALDMKNKMTAARERVAQHPLVVDAINVLGAELREVQLP